MSRDRNTLVYVFFYKEGPQYFADSVYQAVMAGNALHPNAMGIPGDDSGDSISEKNPWYSELTGIYWVWKNTDQPFTGCCHYRRFFTSKAEPFFYQLKRLAYGFIRLYRKRYGLIYTNRPDFFTARILQQQEIDKIMGEYDAILPLRRKLNRSVAKHFQRYHSADDFRILEEVVREKAPAYWPDFQEVMK
ncbi:MAG TPA: DUF4422 domain-containing protein, partial [Prolixibacteraceae bacterium]|nr:DUF4422 domain-containing protein [Prolixibacteraceae bacterium]